MLQEIRKQRWKKQKINNPEDENEKGKGKEKEKRVLLGAPKKARRSKIELV